LNANIGQKGLANQARKDLVKGEIKDEKGE